MWRASRLRHAAPSGRKTESQQNKVQACTSLVKKSRIVWALPKHCEINTKKKKLWQTPTNSQKWRAKARMIQSKVNMCGIISFPHLLPPSKPRSCSPWKTHFGLSTSFSWCTSLWTAWNVFSMPSATKSSATLYQRTWLQSRWKHNSTGRLKVLAFHMRTNLVPCPGSNLTWSASARFNGTCIFFPEMCAFFEQEL